MPARAVNRKRILEVNRAKSVDDTILRVRNARPPSPLPLKTDFESDKRDIVGKCIVSNDAYIGDAYKPMFSNG